MLLLRSHEMLPRRSNQMSWSRTTETSLGVSFETYLRRRWDVQRDVVMISLQRLVAGWVVLYYYAKQKIKDDYVKERIKEDDLILRFLCIRASAADAAAVNPKEIKAFLTNGLISFFINGNPFFNSKRSSLPRNPSDSFILDALFFL